MTDAIERQQHDRERVRCVPRSRSCLRSRLASIAAGACIAAAQANAPCLARSCPAHFNPVVVGTVGESADIGIRGSGGRPTAMVARSQRCFQNSARRAGPRTGGKLAREKSPRALPVSRRATMSKIAINPKPADAAPLLGVGRRPYPGASARSSVGSRYGVPHPPVAARSASAT